MRVHQIIADLPVPDLESAAGFYTDYLGLSVEEFNLGWVARYTSPDTGAHLQLVTHDATAPANPIVSVKVDDVDAAYAEAQQRGYEIAHPLRRGVGCAPVLRAGPRRQRAQHRAAPRVRPHSRMARASSGSPASSTAGSSIARCTSKVCTRNPMTAGPPRNVA